MNDLVSITTPAAYDRLLARSQAIEFSMNSDLLTGSLLRTLAASKPGGAFLELGTGCGLGTSWLLDGMDASSSLVSIDTDPRAQEIVSSELGVDSRLTLVLQDGGEFLTTCDRRFDLIYADAWPGKYSHLDEALALLAPGGLYVIDDMLPQPNWPPDHGGNVAALIDVLEHLPALMVTKLSWSTGVIVATRR